MQTLGAALAAGALCVLAACGSGGKGGSGFGVKSTIFGYDPFTGNFDASGQQGEAPVIPLNMCVVFDFTEPIAAGTANASSIVVQELDTSVTPPAPGPLAAVTFDVAGNRLTICPLITFSDTNAIFGWGDQSVQKTYQILFQVSPSTSVLSSVHGQKLGIRDRGPYLFQTSTQIFDQNPGAPVPTVRLLDPVSGAVLPFANTPFEPVPLVEITFDEPVIPSTAVDPGGAGTSSNIHIELDTDLNVNTTADRIVVPGTYTLTETSIDATVLWTSNLAELPTELPSGTNPIGGCLYVITVDGTVQDLSGNDKVTIDNDPGAKDVVSFRTLPGPSTSPVDPAMETFDSKDNDDLTITSASWGDTFPGFLSPGVGGGTGADGDFDPVSPIFQGNLPSGVTIDIPNKIVTLNTDSLITPGTQRNYEFTLFKVPAGWTARAIGPFPLSIQVSGNVTVTGILTVAGARGAIYANGAVVGGPAGAGALGGASGGRGGAPTDNANVDTFFPNKVGAPVTYAGLAFNVSSATNQGLSGRNTALNSTAFTLTDSNFAANLNPLAVTDLWVQPNVGADDYRFERFHPAFKVESIAAGVVTVISDPNDPDYRGPLSQETINPWLEPDGSGGIRAPLLAETFDSYVIGELKGLAGSAAFDLDLDGLADDDAKTSAGSGSDPQAVAQTFLTLGHSGGGGGGGGITAGVDGEDDPTVIDGPGGFGGTGFEGGAGGAALPGATLLARIDADTLRTTTAAFDDGTGSPDPTFVGMLVNPNVNQGNTFTITSVDATDTVTIQQITTSSGLTINLNNTLMSPGNTVRISPPYTAGGTGGAGAGMHCAGSSKVPVGHTGDPPLVAVPGFLSQDNVNVSRAGIYDDDNNGTGTQDGLEDYNEPIFTLPRWIPGGGGAAGGGVLELVAAGSVDISAAAQVVADGGEGGRSDVAGTTSASGGGGGAGGTIFIGAGNSLTVAIGGRISAAGGLGGAQGFGIEGGAGAPGRIRLENALGNLLPAGFAGVGIPPITAEHLGTFPGGGASIAQSLFLSIGALNPEFQQIVVNYTTVRNGTPTNATYIVLRDGTVDPASTVPVPPFDLLVSTTPADPITGLPDLSGATPFADPTVTPMMTYDGNGYVRFKIILGDSSTPIVIGADTFTNVRIDDIAFNANSVKP